VSPYSSWKRRARWVGFGLVWLALVVFTVDLLRARPRRDAALPVEVH